MIELELLGTSSDGESLVLTDAQGERYSVLISDELRGATRRGTHPAGPRLLHPLSSTTLLHPPMYEKKERSGG